MNPTFSPRPYNPDRIDLSFMAATVLQAWRPQRRPYAYFHPGDLYWRLREAAFEQDLWIWEVAPGRSVGFCSWNARRRSIEVQAHPLFVDTDLRARMLEWAEAQSAPEGVTSGPVTAYAMDADHAMQALLESRGYEKQAHYTNFHRRSLDDLPAAPPLPPGFRARHLRWPDELTARVAAHRAGWESTRMTVENYRRLASMPGYRGELDIVVEAPDGTLVACCNCWLDEDKRTGLFEPVSVHADYRRLGLGKALIHKGLEQLREGGAREAWVGSDADGLAATRLYESCGMPVVQREYDWRQTGS